MKNISVFCSSYAKIVRGQKHNGMNHGEQTLCVHVPYFHKAWSQATGHYYKTNSTENASKQAIGKIKEVQMAIAIS